MKNVISALNKIIPEGMESLQLRYNLLQVILEHQPVGRRKLSTLTAISERVIRSETEQLSKQGLITVKTTGMMLTIQGQKVLDRLFIPINQLEYFSEIEQVLEEKLSLKKAIIVKGDSDEGAKAKWRLGKAGADVLKSVIRDGSIIALTGGSSVAKVVESMSEKSGTYKEVTIVPARGSVGECVETQGNTLVVNLAKKLEADYTLLHIPDNLSELSVQAIKQEAHVQKTLQIMAKSDIIMFGIGNAIQMATQRKEDTHTIRILEKREAIGEAFRYYFNLKGEIVYGSANIGLERKGFSQIPNKIAVVGGRSKALAILSVKSLLKDAYLVIDEAAANVLVEFLKNNKICQ